MEFCGEQANKTKKNTGEQGNMVKSLWGTKQEFQREHSPLPPPSSSSKELNLLLNFKLSKIFRNDHHCVTAMYHVEQLVK